MSAIRRARAGGGPAGVPGARPAGAPGATQGAVTRARDRDVAAVELDQPPDEREPEAQAPLRAVERGG